MIEKIGATIVARSLGRRRKANDLADFSANEATDFWFLHTLNTHLPELVHIWKVRRGHPDVLYRAMLRLAGALTTFSLAENVQSLPEYDHNSLGESFSSLDDRIRMLLDGFNTREKCIVTRLRPVEQFIWSGALDDERQLGASQVILSVTSPIAADELLSKFTRLVKVSNSDDLTRLIRSSLPGINMRHLPTPPPSAQFNLNCHYFGLTTSGPLWENVLRTRSISVFVPGEIADPKLELLALLE
jgi:type VI secretion system protein ImpJ